MLNRAGEIDCFNIIRNAMTTLGEHYESNATSDPSELAYLALTAKLELVIRDKLAYRLQKDEALKSLVVRREWKKVDLAILSLNPDREGVATFGLQLKAKSSSYKIVREANKLQLDASNDLVKCKEKVEEACTLLIAPHFDTDPGILFDKYGWKHVTENEVNEAVVGAFGGWYVVGSNNGEKIEAGLAFKTHVSVLYWLCKPR